MTRISRRDLECVAAVPWVCPTHVSGFLWLLGQWLSSPSAGTWTWACGPRRCRRWCVAASPRRCGARCGSCWQGVTTTTTSWRSTGSSSQRYPAFFRLSSPFVKEWEYSGFKLLPEGPWVYLNVSRSGCDSILQQKPWQRAAGGTTLLSFYSPVSLSQALSL